MSTLSSVPVRKIDRKKREKEARIRRAALALIRERGFEAMTTRELAERAGIAAGTLFLYVKSKDELLDFVFAGEIGAVVDGAWATLPRRGALESRLMHLFGALVDFYARDLALARLLLRDAVLPRPGSRSLPLTFAFLHRVGELVAAEQGAGRLAAHAPPVELALHAFQLYVGAVLGVATGLTTAEEARAGLRRALDVHFSGLKPHPPRRKP